MDHVPIRVSTLRGDQKIDFDAYVKINDKYILYLRQGDSFEGARLKRLKDKKLKKMFILDSAEESYRTYLARNIEMAYDSKSGKTIENRSEIVQGAQQSAAENVMEDPDDVDSYNSAKDGTEKFVEFLRNEEAALLHVLNVENIDKNIAHHGVTVSALAVALAKKLGPVDMKLNQLLSMGAMLHDFEHFSSGINVARPLDQFSEADLKIYHEHPVAGGRKLQDKKHFDQSVVNIIVQHEEFIDGKGWPQGLKESQMDPLAVIVGSANALDRIITFEGKSRKEAAKQLMVSGLGKHPLQHLQLLSEIANQLDQKAPV